jgi:hypothetical protein
MQQNPNINNFASSRSPYYYQQQQQSQPALYQQQAPPLVSPFENSGASMSPSSPAPRSRGLTVAEMSPSKGLANVAAGFDALQPMFRAMRDLEAGKDHELQLAREQLAAKDREIARLRGRVKELEEAVRAGALPGKSTDALLMTSGGYGDLNNDLNNSNHQFTSASGTPREASATMTRGPDGRYRSPVKSQQQQQNKQQQQTSSSSYISDQERQELEEMLSRSIAGLADAERALVSERSRFLVVDPTLIPMDRWRAAVSRLADLHDEVAHRRFGACLAAARLSGQMPSDVRQVAASQFLRGALSPVLLTHMASCFKRAKAEEAEALQSDPWKMAERQLQQLVEEPDMLLHHVNAVIERLVVDPGDEYVRP